jgi:hypothetical protein
MSRAGGEMGANGKQTDEWADEMDVVQIII